MKMTRISRFGNVICDVPSHQAVIAEWIRKNVQPLKATRMEIGENADYAECMDIARKRGYTFRSVKVEIQDAE